MDTRSLYPAGRALVGTLFAVSGFAKIAGFEAVVRWMAAGGVPAPVPLLVLTIALEVGAGLALATGRGARFAAAALAAFVVPVTLVFHAFWLAGAGAFQDQLAHFLKNVAILGALLVLFDAEQRRHAARARASRQVQVRVL